MDINRDEIIKIAKECYCNDVEINSTAFKKDFHIFFTIRKMVRRFIRIGVISDKLLLNNIIICHNMFGISAVNIIIRMICDQEEQSIVFSFLNFLDCYIAEYDDPDQNNIIVDLLNDVKQRYNLQPHQE
jgi:hypothetical protein